MANDADALEVQVDQAKLRCVAGCYPTVAPVKATVAALHRQSIPWDLAVLWWKREMQMFGQIIPRDGRCCFCGGITKSHVNYSEAHAPSRASLFKKMCKQQERARARRKYDNSGELGGDRNRGSLRAARIFMQTLEISFA